MPAVPVSEVDKRRDRQRSADTLQQLGFDRNLPELDGHDDDDEQAASV
jgi:hypothetical protein